MVLAIKKINHKLKLPLPGSTNTNLGANKSKKTVMYLKKKKKHQSVKPPTEVLKAWFQSCNSNSLTNLETYWKQQSIERPQTY